jgi:hypothetical protein
MRRLLCLAVTALAMFAGVGRAQAPAQAAAPQTPPAAPVAAPTPWWSRLPLEFNGTATTMTEFYRHGGETAARRPAGLYRASMSPQVTLFGEVTAGVDLMVSSEGSEFRQNVNQFGINPSWRWVTVHAGDFSRDYSPLSMQGTRLRGGGVDLRPGPFFFSLQTGRAQRTVASNSDGAAYRRDLLALAVGVGREGGNRFAITALKAKDDPTSLEQSLVIVDSTVSDTALVPDPLRFATSPQENLVVGLQTELDLFRGVLHFKGEGGASLFTRDLRSETIGDEGVGALGAVSALQPLRLSTSGDAAFSGDLEVRLPSFGLRGGYEHVGPGYTSLGIPHLISDRRGYHFGGNVGFFSNRLSLQGETRWQGNNLAGQRAAKTIRSMTTASAVAAFSAKLTVATTVTTSQAATGTSDIAPGVDMNTLVATTAVSSRFMPMARPTTLSLAYSYQKSLDLAPATAIPPTFGHNVTASVSTTFTPRLSFGPSLSLASNQTGVTPVQRNVLAGFNLRAKLLARDRLTLAGNVSTTFASGREVKSARAEAGYTLFWDSRLVVQARHSSYGAFATRKAFDESFLTMSLSRSLSTGRR